jgi:hypothetical protein
MKITDVSATYNASKLKKLRKAGDGNFGEFLSAAEAEEVDQTAGSGGTLAAMEAGAINPFLALQEVSEEETRRQKSLQQGRQSLDMLDALRREILTGQTSTQTIKRMQNQVDQIRANTPPDPRLQEIMGDIELRLAVEAAKLEKINFSA